MLAWLGSHAVTPSPQNLTHFYSFLAGKTISSLLTRPLTPTCNYVSGPPPTSLLEQQNFRNIAIRMRIFHMQLCMAALVPLLTLLVFTRYFL